MTKARRNTLDIMKDHGLVHEFHHPINPRKPRLTNHKDSCKSPSFRAKGSPLPLQLLQNHLSTRLFDSLGPFDLPKS